MTRAQLEEIRACVEGEELIGGSFERNGACCFIGKLTKCYYPELFLSRSWSDAELELRAQFGFDIIKAEQINDQIPGIDPSPLRAPAVLAYLETLVED